MIGGRDGEALSVSGLRALSPLKRVNAVRLWLRQEGAEAPPTARLAEALRQVFDAEADHQPAIVFGPHALRRYRQRLFVTGADPPRVPDAQAWIAAEGSSIELGQRLGNLTWIAGRGGTVACQRHRATARWRGNSQAWSFGQNPNGAAPVSIARRASLDAGCVAARVRGR